MSAHCGIQSCDHTYYKQYYDNVNVKTIHEQTLIFNENNTLSETKTPRVNKSAIKGRIVRTLFILLFYVYFFESIALQH